MLGIEGGAEVLRFRTRLTMARLIAIPAIVGLTFALGSRNHVPWDLSVVCSGLFLLPVFVSGATLRQWLWFYGIAGIVLGLMSPGIKTHHDSAPWVVPVSGFGPPYQVEVHPVGKNVIAHSTARTSADERAVSEWIQSHSRGWKRDFLRYPPCRVIRGSGFRLNFLNGRCVLEYFEESEGGWWVQVSRPLASEGEVPDVFADGRGKLGIVRTPQQP
ncbi:MAG: hypothetical protein U0835_04850 [Isosphaeraceae bacterium]